MNPVVNTTIKQIISKWCDKFSGGNWLYFLSDIPTDKLSRAKMSYASFISEEMPLVLYDPTLFGKGEKGFVITDQSLYSNVARKHIAIRWSNV